MVLCLKIYHEGGEGGTESSCPGGGGGEVRENLVAQEVGGGEVGENLVSQEGREAIYTIYFFTLEVFFICQINKIDFFSCYKFIFSCLTVHQEPKPEPEPFYF